MRADDTIAEIASRQHGLVTRAQLLAAGHGADVISRRVRNGRLIPLHRGVYQAGPVAAPRARIMAAVLASSGGLGAAREGAKVSHHTAAQLWRLPSAVAEPELVDVLVPGLVRGMRRGVRAHRADGLAADEATCLHGIPITTPARTILDVAPGMGPREVERLVAHAEREELATGEQLASLLQRHPRHRGAPALRRVLALQDGPQLTRSEAESQMLELLRRGRLPSPAVNARVEGFEVDFLWRRERLVVEVDGFAFHSSARAFERDRRRDAAITAAGLRVLRFTWKQIEREPEFTLVAITRALVR